MVKVKKYHNTNMYNWEILSDDTYILWVRRNERGGSRDGFIQFSYYLEKKLLRLDQGINIDCQTIDEANYFVSKILKRYYVDIPEEFCGKYFKLKKLQSICQKVSKKVNFTDKIT